MSDTSQSNVPTVVLIGPQRTGKTAVGKLLAERLGLPFADVLREAQQIATGHGFNPRDARAAWEQHGLEGALRYHAPFDALVVEQMIGSSTGVFELGAFQAIPHDPACFERVQTALRPVPYVVLLRPSPDDTRSIDDLNERGKVYIDGMEINEHFVRHHSNADLAKLVIYTHGKTPQQVAGEVAAQLDPSSETVVLIGPFGAGKSTIGKLLAERLGRPQRSLDDLRWGYYKEIGFDMAEQQAAGERDGFLGVYRYWKQFEAHGVKRVLEEHPGAVIDFGAGHSVQEDDAKFARVEELLAPLPNVVLLLPTPDPAESVAILAERKALKVGGIPLVEYMVTHPGYRQLATHTLYTDGRTPEETSNAIAALVNGA